MKCPKCGITQYQSKAGYNRSGSQRYHCTQCGAKYTPVRQHHGYPLELRTQAIRLYVDGLNFRRIARQLGVHHQTVINCVNAYVAALPPAAVPQQTTIELDELYTFVGEKKTKRTS